MKYFLRSYEITDRGEIVGVPDTYRLVGFVSLDTYNTPKTVACLVEVPELKRGESTLP